MKFVIFLLNILILFTNCVSTFKLAESDTDFKRDESQIYTRKIQFINSKPLNKDENRCSFIKLDKKSREYITEVQPIADKGTAHHMTLYGCNTIVEFTTEENTNTWNCGELGVCGDEYSRRLYTWALNAKGVKYPDGVGIRVGGDTGLDYLVVEVHYNRLPSSNKSDSISSYNLRMTTQDLPYQVGVYNIGNDGIIPPKRQNFTFESGCVYEVPYSIVPIYYRTHAHNIVSVMSIYLVKNEQWVELGRMSPHQPQMFYTVTNKDYIIENNDIIAARCTINSMDREKFTITGTRHEDEMCAFYLMFYTDYKGMLDDYYCYKDGNKFSWNKDLNITTNSPDNASNLEGVFLVEPQNELKMNHHH